MSELVAVLPVGATEQHGPHLGVGVDAVLARGVVTRAIELMSPDFPALVLPVQEIGKSDEHSEFSGSLAFSYDLVARMWFQIGEAVYRSGCRKIVFVNAHGGNRAVMEIVCRELRVKLGMLAVASSWSRIFDRSDLFSEFELKHGVHGGEFETSAMLHIRPDLVDMAYADNFETVSVSMAQENTLLGPHTEASFAWQAQDLHPAGASGNAAAADAERGKESVDRAAKALLTIISEMRAFPLDRLKRETEFNRSSL
ncbi:creatinine amidohydrolase [Devosia sp. 2618]